LDVVYGLVAVGRRESSRGKECKPMTGVAVLVNLLAVLSQLLPPVLTNAVGEDRDLVVCGPINVNRISPLVLASPERLDTPMPDTRMLVEGHQVMAHAIELAVVGELFDAVDNGICCH